MYWATRSVITSQPAMTTTTVMKAVSGTNHIEMPSTPEVVAHVEALDPGLVLQELHRRGGDVEAGDQRQRDQQAGHGADQRQPAHHHRVVVAAEREQQQAERRSAARSRDSKDPCCCSPPCRSTRPQGRQGGPQSPRQQAEHAQHHHQRVPVQVAGLHQARQPRHAADHRGRAVDRHAVDQPPGRRPSTGPARRRAPPAPAGAR